LKWEQYKLNIVTWANSLKFDQNPLLRAFLIDTYPFSLVESSKTDLVWGCGEYHKSSDQSYITGREMITRPQAWRDNPGRRIALDHYLPLLWNEGDNHEMIEIRKLSELALEYPCAATYMRFYSGYKPVRFLPVPTVLKGTRRVEAYMHRLIFWDMSVLILICGIPVEAMICWSEEVLDLYVDVVLSAYEAETKQEKQEQCRKRRARSYLRHMSTLTVTTIRINSPKEYLNLVLYGPWDVEPDVYKHDVDDQHVMNKLLESDTSPTLYSQDEVHEFHIREIAVRIGSRVIKYGPEKCSVVRH